MCLTEAVVRLMDYGFRFFEASGSVILTGKYCGKKKFRVCTKNLLFFRKKISETKQNNYTKPVYISKQ